MGHNCSNGSCTCHGASKKAIALLILRLALGIIFVYHGYGKLFGGMPGMEMFTGMVGKMGFPLPVVFAYAAALTEFLGGIAMILGVFTHIVGWLMAIVMLVAFIGVKKFSLPAGDPDLALLAMSIALALMGPGAYSLMSKMGGACKRTCSCKGCSCGSDSSPATMDTK